MVKHMSALQETYGKHSPFECANVFQMLRIKLLVLHLQVKKGKICYAGFRLHNICVWYDSHSHIVIFKFLLCSTRSMSDYTMIQDANGKASVLLLVNVTVVNSSKENKS